RRRHPRGLHRRGRHHLRGRPPVQGQGQQAAAHRPRPGPAAPVPRRVSQQDWLGWVERLQAIAQAGLELSDGPYDRERYLALRALATEIAAAHLELGSPAERRRGAGVVAGRWSLPGGWADVGWAPAAMVEREVAEESGFQVRARRLLALW